MSQYKYLVIMIEILFNSVKVFIIIYYINFIINRVSKNIWPLLEKTQKHFNFLNWQILSGHEIV